MTILDTHVWLWWLNDPEKLSPSAREAIDSARASSTLAVSTMSVWELALLVKKGRLELRLDPADVVAHCERLRFLSFVPITAPIALRSVSLEPFHSDPADRLIVATAAHTGATLVTKDDRIRESGAVTTVW